MADKPTLLQEAFMEAVRPSACGRTEMPALDRLGVRCRLDRQWLGYWGAKPTGVACGEPSSATVRFTCKHEWRRDDVRACSRCAAAVQQAAGQITCKPCWDAADRHRCYMAVVINWDGGDETIVQEAYRG